MKGAKTFLLPSVHEFKILSRHPRIPENNHCFLIAFLVPIFCFVPDNFNSLHSNIYKGNHHPLQEFHERKFATMKPMIGITMIKISTP